MITDESMLVDVLNTTLDYINEDDKNSAFEVMDEFMQSYDSPYKNDENLEYHYFENPLDEILFNEYIKTDREVKIISSDEPVCDLYYIYGFLLLENKKYDEAEDALNKALEYNPVSASIILELSEIYRIKKDLEKYKEYVKRAYTFSYQPGDLATVYRNMGYYYTKEKNYELAIALYLHSIKYELNNLAYMEIEKIEEKGYETNMKQGEEVSILEENDIPTEANSFIIETVKKIAKEFEMADLYNQANYFYKILYELTLDDNVLDIIYKLEKKI